MTTKIDPVLSTVSARNQMAFQERMSNTAHQRETRDLIAAGLNPVLSAGGSGASTPSGAEGDYSNGEMLNLLASSIATSAAGVNAVKKGLDIIQEDQKFDIQKAMDEWKRNYADVASSIYNNPSAVSSSNLLSKTLDFLIPEAEFKNGKAKMSDPARILSKLPFGVGSWITGLAYDATQKTGRDFGKLIDADHVYPSGVAEGITKIIKDKKSPSKKSYSSRSNYRGGSNR